MNNSLGQDYWEDRWVSQQTGWDIGIPSPALTGFIDTILDKNARILIPGCGNAYEADYLLEKGYKEVTILDISPSLTQQLAEEYKDTSLIVVCGDYFQHEGQYDYILEQTFFCALPRSLRQDYAAKSYELLADKGVLAGVLFNKEFEKEGPPFGGSEEEYRKIFAPFFDIAHMSPCTNSIAPRRGTELFIRLVKKTK